MIDRRSFVSGLAAGIGAYSLGETEGSLLGAIAFAPVGAFIGVALSYRTIKDQVKGGRKDFWDLG